MWLTFEQWWRHEGSGMLPRANDDMETHARATAMAAWGEARKNAKMICVNCGEQMMIKKKVQEFFDQVKGKPLKFKHNNGFQETFIPQKLIMNHGQNAKMMSSDGTMFYVYNGFDDWYVTTEKGG